MTIPTNILRKSLGASADFARLWFEDRTEPLTREVFKARGQLNDSKKGAVYGYFQGDNALYIGLTSRGVKERTHAEKARHTDTKWWEKWTTLRFIQLEDDMDRQILEFLLILSYGPKFNVKPKAKNLNELLP